MAYEYIELLLIYSDDAPARWWRISNGTRGAEFLGNAPDPSPRLAI